MKKYYAEAVLDGHVDRFCDLLADRLLEHAAFVDPEVHGQIEAAIWKNHLWLSGAILSRTPFTYPTREIVRELWSEIGIRNSFADLEIADHIDRYVGDPRPRRERVNDQCIAIGWAGYDEKTNFHPPEHFLALYFKDALDRASRAEGAKRFGPDGKLLVHTEEDGEVWRLTEVLVSIQHSGEVELDTNGWKRPISRFKPMMSAGLVLGPRSNDASIQAASSSLAAISVTMAKRTENSLWIFTGRVCRLVAGHFTGKMVPILMSQLGVWYERRPFSAFKLEMILLKSQQRSALEDLLSRGIIQLGLDLRSFAAGSAND